MLQSIILLVLLIGVCSADLPVTPPASQTYCGKIPDQVYRCSGIPKVISPEVARKCQNIDGGCEKMTCVFREFGWLLEGKVDRVKPVHHFEQLAKEKPQWATAVQHLKQTCLSENLPPQGIHLNCPAYDIMMCSLAAFIKHADPSQWSSSKACEYPKQYAGSCPVCPEDCFATAVPFGSCNACLTLPRSP